MTSSSSSSSVGGWKSLSKLGKAGVIGQFGGIATSLIGSYFASQTAKFETKMSGLRYEHRKDMSLFNMRMKESQAQYLNRVFNQRYMKRTLKQGGDKSTAKTQFAARGIQMGVGSTLNAFVSDGILKELDKITMNTNKVKAVWDKRVEGVSLGIQADAYGLSASNAFATASNISPWMDMSSSLLTGTTSLIGSLPKSFWLKQ